MALLTTTSELGVDTIVGYMLGSRENYEKIRSYMREVMSLEERAEREYQSGPQDRIKDSKNMQEEELLSWGYDVMLMMVPYPPVKGLGGFSRHC